MTRIKDANLWEAIGDYLDVYLPVTRGASPHTVKSYETALALFDEYLKETGGVDGGERAKGCGLRKRDMSCFRGKNVLGYLDWLRDARGNAAATRKLRLSAIVGFVDYATIRDMSNASLLVEVSRVKVGTRRDVGRIVGHMSERGWDALVKQPDVAAKRTEHRNWVFMVLMYELAARVREVIDLRAKDVILDCRSGAKAKVYIKGKGSKERVIPIRESTARIVEDYMARFHPGRNKSNDPLFYVMHDGEKCHMSPDAVEKFLARYGNAARKKCPEVPERVHPHLIRHTRAVHLLEGGMSLEDLSKLLGHEDISTTRVYVQSSAEAKRASLAKASGKSQRMLSKPGFWEGDEETIRRLERPSRR